MANLEYGIALQPRSVFHIDSVGQLASLCVTSHSTIRYRRYFFAAMRFLPAGFFNDRPRRNTTAEEVE